MRLFIAINLEDGMKDGVLAVRREMERRGVRGNFTKEENLHLTLAFIGEYPDPDAVADVMESVPFTACLSSTTRTATSAPTSASSGSTSSPL